MIPALRALWSGHGGLAGLAAAVRSGLVAADEPARLAYAEIARRDAELHAFTQVFPAAGPSPATGALDGLPVAVKDNIDVAGRVTSAGRPLTERTTAGRDAAAVRLLRAAGAVIVGKTNLPEFASAAVTVNHWYGNTRNPHDLARTAGGSSGGSAAAVAADLVVAALATDTGGSALIPAALTGVCGFRPTPGRISTAGVLPLSRTLDTVGFIAPRITDLVDLHRVLDPAEQSARPPAEPRVGILTGWFRDADPGVLAAVDRFLDGLRAAGARIVPVELPSAPLVQQHARVVFRIEVAEVFATLLDPDRRYAATVEARRTHDHTHGDLAAALEFRERWRADVAARQRWRADVAATFAGVDLLACPTTPTIAPCLDADPEQATARLVRFTYPFCYAGTPMVTVPAGHHDGLPVGLTFIAPPGHDRALLELTATLSAADVPSAGS